MVVDTGEQRHGVEADSLPSRNGVRFRHGNFDVRVPSAFSRFFRLRTLCNTQYLRMLLCTRYSPLLWEVIQIDGLVSNESRPRWWGGEVVSNESLV
jgi:hypothetical protein